MREILFRAKRLTGGMWLEGMWLEGSLWMDNGAPKILTPGNCVGYDVDPATIGQYTGIKDRDGKRVFEGDVVQEVYGEKVYNKTFVVSMDPDRRGWFPFACGDGCGCCETDVWTPDHALVIGNVHDNPELLKGDEP